LKSKGIGIIITDHNVRETFGVCDRAYIINEGRILEEGPPEKIAQSRKARQIYLGEGFQLIGGPRHRRETTKDPSTGDQMELWK